MEANILGNLATLTGNNTVNKVVVSGTWDEDALDMLVEAKPDAVIVLEPNNENYQSTSAKYADNPIVKVWEATLAESTGQASYFLFQPHRFSSLLKPKKLQKIYKKQKANSIIDVATIDLQSLCEQENISKQGDNVLLLGANSPSSSILNLEQMQALTLFDVLVLRYPQQDLYDSQGDKAALLSLLAENSFKIEQELSRDALFTQFVFTRDHQSEKINSLQAKVAESESRNLELEAALSKLKAQNEENKQMFSAESVQLKERNQKLSGHNTQIKEQTEKLRTDSAELKAQIEKLSTDGSQHKEHSEKLNADCAQLREQNKNLNVQNAELKTQVEQFNTDIAQAKEQNEKLSAESTQFKAQIEKFSTDGSQHKEHSEKLNADCAQLREQNKNLNVQNAELKTQVEQFNTDIAQAKEQNEKLSADGAQLKEQTGKLVTESAQVNERNQNLSAHNTQLKEQNEKLSADGVQHTEQNEKLKTECAELTKLNKEINETKKLLNEKLLSCELENGNLSLNIKAQVTEIAKLLSEKDFISSKNNDLEACITELDEEVLKLEAQIELVNRIFIQT